MIQHHRERRDLAACRQLRHLHDQTEALNLSLIRSLCFCLCCFRAHTFRLPNLSITAPACRLYDISYRTSVTLLCLICESRHDCRSKHTRQDKNTYDPSFVLHDARLPYIY